MDNDNKVSRRAFIKIAAAGTSTLTLTAANLSLIEGCASPPQHTRHVLSSDEYHLVAAIAEQIVPTDAWPGGRDAGVADFIDIQLAGPYRRYRQDYTRGLAAIEHSCLTTYHARFETLSWDDQTGFLLDMQSGTLHGDIWKDGFSTRFFELLRAHSMQGFYGSPRHGGNKDFVSYRMIGLDVVQTVGQNRHGVAR